MFCMGKKRTIWRNRSKKKSGIYLLSRGRTAVPSARERFTSVFGMGTGISTLLWTPEHSLEGPLRAIQEYVSIETIYNLQLLLNKCIKKSWQRPTLPRTSRSTIGARAFYFRVRDGNGYFHSAMATSRPSWGARDGAPDGRGRAKGNMAKPHG